MLAQGSLSSARIWVGSGPRKIPAKMARVSCFVTVTGASAVGGVDVLKQMGAVETWPPHGPAR